MEFAVRGGSVVFLRLGLELTSEEWDAFLSSDELSWDDGWQSSSTLENYLAAERQVPLYLARTRPEPDLFAGEEFTDEY